MNQDSRIENTRKLAIAFANSVTAKTTAGNCWIARKGEATLFRVLQQILPQVKAAHCFCSASIPPIRDIECINKVDYVRSAHTQIRRVLV